MANLIKPKIGVSAFAVSILVIIPLLESNFFKPVVIKKWSKLSWNDFQGFVPPFTGYGAGISSEVYLEYDSSLSKYHAYAGQNNVRSWTKRSTTDNEYSLTHEQYHFNITELHARMLNQYIDENPQGSEGLFLLRLGSINITLNEMQDQYDNETDHSTIFDKQRRWEYRIDSLLTLGSGWVVDHYSGARLFFPQKPDSTKNDKSPPRRGYTLEKYGMNLGIFSFLRMDENVSAMGNNLQSFYASDSLKIKSIVFDPSQSLFDAFVIVEDTTNNYTHYHRWVYQSPYLYKVLAKFPNNTGDTTGYSKNAMSFINSFSIVDQDQYWINKLKKENNPIEVSSIVKFDVKKESSSEVCITIGPPTQNHFYRGPFLRDDGSMLIAFDYVSHPDSMHNEDLLLLDKNLYSYTPFNEGQIFFLPKENLPDKKYRIDFGYTLKKDSSKRCYIFHHTSLEVTPGTKATK